MKITESERQRILSKYNSNANYDLLFEQVYIRSNKVKEIQNELNTIYNAGLVADGKLGPKTLAAIKKYLNVNAALAAAPSAQEQPAPAPEPAPSPSAQEQPAPGQPSTQPAPAPAPEPAPSPPAQQQPTPAQPASGGAVEATSFNFT